MSRLKENFWRGDAVVMKAKGNRKRAGLNVAAEAPEKQVEAVYVAELVTPIPPGIGLLAEFFVEEARRAKLQLLFEHYKIKPEDKNSWKMLACSLAIDLVPGMQVLTPSKAGGAVGRPRPRRGRPKDSFRRWKAGMGEELVAAVDKLCADQRLTRKAAIQQLHKDRKWNLGKAISLLTREREVRRKAEQQAEVLAAREWIVKETSFSAGTADHYTRLKKAAAKIVKLAELPVGIQAANTMSDRLADFCREGAHLFQCPRCWINQAKARRLKIVPPTRQTKPFVECKSKKCGFRLELQDGISGRRRASATKI